MAITLGQHWYSNRNYLNSLEFFNECGMSLPQASADQKWCYGMLMGACRKIHNLIINQHRVDQDGFKAWTKFCALCDNNGSENLWLKELEIKLNTELHTSYPGGLTSFIDNFQAKVAVAKVLAPDECLEKRQQHLLFKILDSFEPIQHFVKMCRDYQEWTFDQMATHLRKNAVKLDNTLCDKPKQATEILHAPLMDRGGLMGIEILH